MRVQRSLSALGEESSRTFQRLSSGLRINQTSDDAAGLAISSDLKSRAQIYQTSLRNINDGISAINIADGTYETLSNITTRLLELAEQSANGTYSTVQRRALDSEAQQLAAEFNRQASIAKFNNLPLLSNSSNTITLQVGVDGTRNSQLSIDFGGAASHTAGDGTLGTGANTVTANGSETVTVADVNGDSKLDIISTADSTSRAYVHIGNGDGTFVAPVSYVTGAAPSSIVVTDVTGDSRPDLITSEFTGNSFSVLANNGDGTFAARVPYAAGASVYDLAAGDLDGDTDTDLVVVLQAANQIRVYTNNGTGVFSAGTTYAVGGAPHDVKLADLNADNKLDAITTNTSGDNISIRLGNGDGTFGAVTNYAAGNIGSDGESVVSDFNGDGVPDIATTVRGINAVAIFRGNGNGTFQAAVTYSVTNAMQLAAADMNGDGANDLVVTGFTSGAVSILLNSGSGTFTSGASYTGLVGPESVALGDFNSDGASDVVVSNYSSNRITTYMGNTQLVGGLPTFSLLTQADALSSITVLRDSIEDLAQSRGVLGAGLSRLNIAFRNNNAAREATLSANSRIVDADIADESAALTRQTILKQVAASLLAQANQIPALALDLLGNRR